MLWDKAPYSRSNLVADIPGVGRYLIRRRRSGSREFILLFNGEHTKYYGTIDELKKAVERIAAAKEQTAMSTFDVNAE